MTSPGLLNQLLNGIQKARIASPELALVDALMDIGSFVPVITGGSTPGVGTYTRSTGRYWKLGRLVLVQYRVVTSAHTGTGQTFMNLPFTVSNANDGYFSDAVYSSTHALVFALASPGSPSLSFYAANPGPATSVPAGAGDWLGSILYATD